MRRRRRRIGEGLPHPALKGSGGGGRMASPPFAAPTAAAATVADYGRRYSALAVGLRALFGPDGQTGTAWRYARALCAAGDGTLPGGGGAALVVALERRTTACCRRHPLQGPPPHPLYSALLARTVAPDAVVGDQQPCCLVVTPLRRGRHSRRRDAGLGGVSCGGGVEPDGQLLMVAALRPIPRMVVSHRLWASAHSVGGDGPPSRLLVPAGAAADAALGARRMGGAPPSTPRPPLEATVAAHSTQR